MAAQETPRRATGTLREVVTRGIRSMRFSQMSEAHQQGARK